MTPLHRDSHYTFRFADDRLIPRFHLDGVEPGRRVTVYRLDPQTGRPADMLVRAIAGEGGWVDLPKPLVVRAGEGFVAVPETRLMIREETPADHTAVRELNRLAFGQDDEANLVDVLRAGGHTRLSLVAERDGAVVGHLLFSRLPIETSGGTVEALALAPVTVLPGRQRQGIGSQLIRDGLIMCRQRGHRIVVVLGHAEYYSRFGFSAALAERLRSPAVQNLPSEEPATVWLLGVGNEVTQFLFQSLGEIADVCHVGQELGGSRPIFLPYCNRLRVVAVPQEPDCSTARSNRIHICDRVLRLRQLITHLKKPWQVAIGSESRKRFVPLVDDLRDGLQCLQCRLKVLQVVLKCGPSGESLTQSLPHYS